MPRHRKLKVVAGIAASFIGFAGTIVYLAAAKTISLTMAKLLLAALVGMYFGFGVLIAVYLSISKLK